MKRIASRWRALSLVGVAAAALVVAGCSGSGSSDGSAGGGDVDYPTGNVEFVVPFGAGGGTDSDARAVVAAMDAAAGGGNLVVNNISGGGGTLGLVEAFQRPADGKTVGLVFPSIHAMGEEVFDAAYDLESLEYIGGFRESYNMIAVPASSGIETLDELLEAGKEKGRLVVVSGPASAFLVTASQILETADIEMESLGYEGVPQAFAGLEAGDGDFWMGGDGAAASLGDSANILAYAAPERSELLPDVPTLSELGYDDIYLDPISAGFAVRGDTDPAIVEILRDLLKEAVNSDEVREYAEETRASIVYIEPDAFKDSVLEALRVTAEYRDVLSN